MATIKIIPQRDIQPKRLRVAAYCRVSSDSSDQLHSYAAQIHVYTEQIQSHEGWELVDIYADAGQTGTRTNQRQEFNRMMEDCRKGKIDRILVKSVSRFARNTKDCLVALRELSGLGVSVVFEEDHIDTGTLTTEMMVSVFGSLAQQESMSISQNQRMSYQRRMERGEYISCIRLYGYRLVDGKHLEIIPEEAKWVKWIYHAYLSGKSAEAIGQELREKQVPNRDNRIGWQHAQVLYILGNEKYIGDSLCQKSYRDEFPYTEHRNRGERDKYYIEGTHPAIISKETFEKVQTLRRQKRIPNANPYLDSVFSKKIKCGCCGAVFRRRLLKDGTAFWVCRRRNNESSACAVGRILEEDIQSAFIALIHKLRAYEDIIFAPALTQLQDLADAVHRDNTELLRLNVEIAEMAEKAHKIRSLHTAGIISEDICVTRVTAVNAELDRLRRTRRKLLQNDEIDGAAQMIRKVINVIRDCPEELTWFDEELFAALVDHIIAETSTELRFCLNGGIELLQKVGD